MRILNQLIIWFLFLVLLSMSAGCSTSGTWKSTTEDSEIVGEGDIELIDITHEVGEEHLTDMDNEIVDVALNEEDVTEEQELDLETDNEIAIEETVDFKLPEFQVYKNLNNTEGSGTLYASIVDEDKLFVLWFNYLGARFNEMKISDNSWTGEKLLISELQNGLQNKVAPPLQYCTAPTPDCSPGEPLPKEFWDVKIYPFSCSSFNSTYSNIWRDKYNLTHVLFGFEADVPHNGLIDFTFEKDPLDYKLTVLEDFGRDFNEEYLRLLREGKEPTDASVPRLGLNTYFDWGSTSEGCGIFYGVTGDILETNIDWLNAVYKRDNCNGVWSERKRIFTMGDAPGTLDDENDQICSCTSDRTGCSCKDILGIYPTKNGLNEIIDPIILEVWYTTGNKPYILMAVWANEEPVKSQIIIDSKSDYDRTPNRIYGVYAFDDGQTWMALGVWETDRFNVKIVPFDENGFKFDKQIKLFEILPRDTPNIPDYLPETYLKSSLGQQPNGRLLSFIRDETEPGVSGGRLVEYKHIHDATGDTVVELTANNPPWLDQTGIMGETILIPDNNGKSILITERLRHPFDLNITKGEGGPSYRDICVYAQNDQGIRENIGCPINSEGFHWSYGAAAWLEEDSSKLPMLLMGGNGNGYFSYLDTKDPNAAFTMLPYSVLPPNRTTMSNGLNGIKDFVAANDYGLETFLLNVKDGGGLKINKIKHFDKIEDGACNLLSIAGGLLRFMCRGKDLYSNFTYTTILCDVDGSCSQPRNFAIDGFETFDTQLIKRSGDYVAVLTNTSFTSSIINFQTWKSLDDGATWTKFGEDFFAFKQFLTTFNWNPYKDGLAGVNILAFENGSDLDFVLKGFKLDIGSGSVKWGDAEIQIGKSRAYLDIAVGSNGKVFAVWRSDESQTIYSVIYDIELDSFSNIDSADLNLEGNISAIKPFVNEAGYCIAIEYIIARGENVGPQQTKTIWGCNEWQP